jgi:hypothetical protein
MSTVTLADAKDYLRMTSTDTARDARLQKYLDAADSQIAYVVGPIAPTIFSEVHDGGGPFIMLRRTPVLSVNSIVEYVGVTPYTLTSQPLGSTTSQYGYSLSSYSGKVTRRGSAGLPTPFMGGRESVAVTYTAGETNVDPAVYLALLEDVRVLWSQSQMGSTVAVVGDDLADSSWAPMTLFPRLQSMLQGARRLPGIA